MYDIWIEFLVVNVLYFDFKSFICNNINLSMIMIGMIFIEF